MAKSVGEILLMVRDYGDHRYKNGAGKESREMCDESMRQIKQALQALQELEGK